VIKAYINFPCRNFKQSCVRKKIRNMYYA